MTDKFITDVVTICHQPKIDVASSLQSFVGISMKNTGASKLSMQLVIIPADAVTTPHTHQDYETAIYVLEGKAETRYGIDLLESCLTEAGEFLYIPPNVPHQVRNMSGIKPVVAIVARSDANEHEHVIIYNPPNHNA